MAASDKIVPLHAAASGVRVRARLPGTPLPGLSLKGIEELAPFYPGTLNPDIAQLLRDVSGLAGTAVGDIDFTGRWFSEEPLSVLRPCLSLAIDEKGRRWIAEGRGENGLPGPVWCVLACPPVAMHVSDDLMGFLSILRDNEHRRAVGAWLQDLTEAAFVIWDRRHGIAMLSRIACLRDQTIRSWLCELPPGALIYDLRSHAHGSGWPYRLGIGESCAYRCGHLPVFAIAEGSLVHGWN